MKKYRTIDLNKWHKTGSGANGDSYLCDDENLMLKLFRKESTEKKAEKEFNMAKKVDSMGIVTAAAYEIVRAGNKFGVIYQNIRNKKSYSKMIADNPERVEEYAKEFAAKAKELHSTPIKLQKSCRKRQHAFTETCKREILSGQTMLITGLIWISFPMATLKWT